MADFPKTETLAALGRKWELDKVYLGWKIGRKSAIYTLPGVIYVKTIKLIFFWLFLIIFGLFGQPRVDIKGCGGPHVEGMYSQMSEFKKKPHNHIILLREMVQNNQKKLCENCKKRPPPFKVVFGPKVVQKSIRNIPHGAG